GEVAPKARVRGLSTSPALSISPTLPLCAPSGKGASFQPDSPHFPCHKNEKSRSKTLSKAGRHWYIPPAPAGFGRGLPSQEAMGICDRRGCRVGSSRFGQMVFSQGSQWLIAGWSSPVARQAHNLKVASSNLAPATKLLKMISRR